MAMNKIERIEKEMEKTREKITEYQNRLRTLEAQKTEAENLQDRPACPQRPYDAAGAFRAAFRRRDPRHDCRARRL